MIDVFMIDPPWPKLKGGLRVARPNQDKQLDYPTMSIGEIFKLLDEKIFLLAEGLSHTVFLWTTDEFLLSAESSMAMSNYRRHARLVWDKTNGVAPAFSVRYCHEYLLWYYKPKFTPVAKDARGIYSTVIRETSRQHSRKPDAAYDMVKALYPDATRLDVFSREYRDGWLCWGNEEGKFNV